MNPLVTLDEIKKLKNEANNSFKAGNFSQAEKEYYGILEKINENETRKEILKEKTILYSNIVIALRKQNKKEEARKIDLLIIKNLDKTFCKSYGRLISEYLNADNFTLARYYYSLMKKYCNEKDFGPFQGIISQIEEEISKRDAFANQFNTLKSAFTKK